MMLQIIHFIKMTETARLSDFRNLVCGQHSFSCELVGISTVNISQNGYVRVRTMRTDAKCEENTKCSVDKVFMIKREWQERFFFD